jgi:hypothetical protein
MSFQVDPSKLSIAKFDVTLGGKLDLDQAETVLDDIALSLLDIWVANVEEEEFVDTMTKVAREFFFLED